MLGGDRFTDGMYVTHRELSDILMAYEVHGDGTTTAVDKQPGGCTIRSTLPISDPSVESTNPIFVSNFNTSASTYEISWRDFDVQFKALDDNLSQLATVSAGTFVFPYADFRLKAKIDIVIATSNNTPYIMWTDTGTSGTPGDTFTTDRRLLAGSTSSGTLVQSFGYPSTAPSNYRNPRVATYDDVSETVPNVDNHYTYTAGTFSLWVPMYIHPTASKTIGPSILNVTVTASTNDFIIIGWTQSSNTKTADLSTNSGSYDEYREIGYIRTDASNNFKGCTVYGQGDVAVVPFGETDNNKQFVDNSGNTHTVRMADGLVIEWKTT